MMERRSNQLNELNVELKKNFGFDAVAALGLTKSLSPPVPLRPHPRQLLQHPSSLPG
jgi:hypothetical protein